MNPEKYRSLWKKEEARAFSGWDFSYLRDRYEEEPLPWDYEERVRGYLKPGVRLLDMGTGGGEFLLSLGHPHELTSVTEGYEPNYRLCLKRLAPLGIRVEFCSCGEQDTMPFEDDSFDLVINRHASYRVEEVRRVLRPGGFFVTQQVGGENGRRLSRRLLGEAGCPEIPFNLENEAPKFKAAGFKVIYGNQAYPVGRFLDIGALCFHAKIIQWEFPGFSVDGCFDRLFALQKEIEERGFVENQEHRFILAAKNQK